MNRLWSLFSGLPRAGKWIVFAVAGVLFYFYGVEPALQATKDLNNKADALARGLAREHELSSPQSEDGRILDVGLSSFGMPYLPTDGRARPDALHKAVDAILRKNGVRDSNIVEKTATLRGDLVTAMAGNGARFDRYVLDVTFETDQQSLVSILSDLERAPEVTAISRVRIDHPAAARGSKGSSRTLRVTISPEIWVAAKGGSAE